MNSGAYQIHITVKKNIKVRIGALGVFIFPKGKYIYTGSARKNLQQRINRHVRDDKKLHWHIDYLLASKYAVIDEIKKFESDKNIECELNLKLLNLKNTEVPVNGFGSSDCKKCPSHLLRLL